jgi:hypothetical protein
MTTENLTWDDIRGRRASVPQQVVHRTFARETVLLNIGTGHYHGMDAIGGRFFEVLLASPNVGAAADQLATDYEQPVERIQEDMAKFCSELKQLGLIELSG